MSLADVIILAIVALAAVGAFFYSRRHPSCTGGTDCASCAKNCAKKNTPPDQGRD
ncbi:MAG: hypothetical protein PHE47_02285 [Oscillospiraceae bacterium]|nr:hypothetical protein [Oscillospiraceae bacterium]